MESLHRKNISKRLRRLSGQLIGIDKMLAENRLLSAIFIQYLAIKGAIKKLFYEQFEEAFRKALIIKINTLLDHPNLPETHRQTLTNIIVRLHLYEESQLTKIILQVEAIEKQMQS